MIQKVSLEKEEENGISIICGRQWEFPGIPAYGPFISLPILVIFPQCQYSQPESRILRTLVLMTVGYVWGLEIRIIKSSHSKQVSTDSIKLVCTGSYCHHSSKHREICFGSLF